MFSERVYELFAEWEQAQEEGTPFDLGRYADSPEYVPLTELISQLRSSPKLGSGNTPQIPAETRRYRFADFIAQGGMGEVWRGFDKRLGREVALKILRKRWGVSAEKLREEAKLVSRLSHPGIAAIHDLDELPDGRPFFVMKLVEGTNLENWLAAQSADLLDIAECLRIFRQICAAAGYAHELDPPLIHRDLKPQNVMIGRHGEVYLMDWGIARTVVRAQRAPELSTNSNQSAISEVFSTTDIAGNPESENGGASTIAGVAKGTIAYMAPEQMQGAPSLICPATDVFGLGGILCRMLTGFPTFRSKEDAADGNVSDAVTRLGQAKADAGLAEIAKRCLMPDISARYMNASVVAHAMSRYESDQIERLRIVELSEARRQTEMTERRMRRRWQFSLGSLAVVLICIALVLNIRHQSSEKQRADQRSKLANDASIQVAEAKLLHGVAMERPLELSGFELAHRAVLQAIQTESHIGDADYDSDAQAVKEEIERELNEVPRNVQFLTDLAAAQLPPIPRRDGDPAEIEVPTYELITNRYAQAFKNRGFDWNLSTTNINVARNQLSQLPKPLLSNIAAQIDLYWLSIVASPPHSWPSDMTRRIQTCLELADGLERDTSASHLRNVIRQRTDGHAVAALSPEIERLFTSSVHDLSIASPGHILVASVAARFQNQGSAANMFLLRAARERPNDLTLLTSAAVVCESAAVPQWKKAVEYRRAMTSLNPNLALGLAYDLLHDRQSKEAELIVRQLHHLRPGSAESYNALGVSLSFQENRVDEEKMMYQESLKLWSEFQPAQRNLKLIEMRRLTK
jgi:serine/threonine protein kinase